MLYIRTWPIPKDLKTPDALIVKIDKNHRLYPPEDLISDFTTKFDELVNAMARNLYAVDYPDHRKIWDMWEEFRDKARQYIQDDPTAKWYHAKCKLLDECLETAYTGRDVIIAVCENRPFYSSWRRILCEYLAGSWKAWPNGHAYAIQADSFQPNTVLGYNGKSMHISYVYNEHPAADRIKDPPKDQDNIFKPATTTNKKPNRRRKRHANRKDIPT